MIHLRTAHLLRRHVADSPDDHACPVWPTPLAIASPAGPHLGRRELGETEIEDLDPLVLRDEDILGLQIAVDDAFFVRRRETVGNLQRVVHDPPDRQRRVAHALAQRLPFEQLRDQVRRALRGTDVVDRENVRVVERRHRTGLGLEAAQPVGVRAYAASSILMATSRASRVSRAR